MKSAMLIPPVLLLCMAMLGCGAAVVVYTPLENTGDAGIAIMPAASMVMGTAGSHYEGIFDAKQYNWTLGQNLPLMTLTSTLSETARNVFTTNGYNAIATVGTVITPAIADDLDYAVMSTITRFEIDTYGFWSKDKTICRMSVNYEITDLQSGQVVAQKLCSGAGYASGVDLMGAIVWASRNSLHCLLADQAIHDILCSGTRNTTEREHVSIERSSPGWFGLKVSTGLEGILAEEFGAPAGSVLVLEVETGSPAEEFGIRVRDVITSIDGLPVTSAAWVDDHISSNYTGEAVTFTWIDSNNGGVEAYISSINPGEGIALEILRDMQTIRIAAIAGQSPKK
ncbi:MAG: PDZ domain-containing protein [Candidatus Sabulitectum sp.]|nr:PDZ domain-containing protein [Candidatus Sabulitectum sp.]